MINVKVLCDVYYVLYLRQSNMKINILENKIDHISRTIKSIFLKTEID